jgi:uncharacterized protein (DUF1697 family)
MKPYIALFRGINVGGRNKLPMRELKEVLNGLGLRNIQTYIQSGNVVFQGGKRNLSELASEISAAIRKSHGFTPSVILLELGAFEKAIASNPYPEAEAEPKTLHLYFLDSLPEDPDLEGLEGLRRENERFALMGKVFYLHAPDGIGRSKLAARVEKSLGVPATARNWRSVCKIMEMAEGNE